MLSSKVRVNLSRRAEKPGRPLPPPPTWAGRPAGELRVGLGGEVLDGWEQPDKFLTPEHEAFLTR